MLRAFQASREGRSWSHGQCQANPSHVQPHLWPPRPVFLRERSWKTWETHEKKWGKTWEKQPDQQEHDRARLSVSEELSKCVEMCWNERSAAANAPGDPKNITSISTSMASHSTLYAFTLQVRCHGKGPWQGSETNLEFDLRYCASSTYIIYIVFSAAVGQFYYIRNLKYFNDAQLMLNWTQFDAFWVVLGGTGWYWVSAHERGQSSDRAGHDLAGSGSRLTTHIADTSTAASWCA